jgi:hypothetical protein
MLNLENNEFDRITTFLTEKELGIVLLNGKLEGFSCGRSQPEIQRETVRKRVFSNVYQNDSELKVESSHSNSSSYSNSTNIRRINEEYEDDNQEEECRKEKRSISEPIQELNIMKVSDPQYLEPWNPHAGDLSTVFNSASLMGSNIRRRANSLEFANNRNGGSRRSRSSSLGDLSKPSARRLLVNLIFTLNDFFPDYDFETTKPEQFLFQDTNEIIRKVNSHLAELSLSDNQFLEKLWHAIDDIVDLRKCEVFSYVSDSDEPFEDDSIWSFNYFFYNDVLKTICYFTCIASRFVFIFY